TLLKETPMHTVVLTCLVFATALLSNAARAQERLQQLTREDAIRMALERNPTLEAKRLELQATQAYRSFVEQTLLLDRQVTVIVGRNDTGKTSILHRFFDQYVFEGVIHSADVPRVAATSGPIQFSLTWDISEGDYDKFPLMAAFGKRGVRSLE